jgi:hypothetical protein
MKNRDRAGQLMVPAGIRTTLRVFLCLALFGAIVFPGHAVFAASPPIKVVVVSGSNYEMGVQYGEQAAELIAANKEVVWGLLDAQVVDSDGVPYGHDFVLKDLQVWTYYLHKYDPMLEDWLNGISQGCKNKEKNVSFDDLMAIMAFPNEIWARPAAPYPDETGVVALSTVTPSMRLARLAKGRQDTKPISSCSSFAATRSATPDGQAFVTITGGAFLEVTNYVILVAFPSEGQRFISLAYAGRVATNAAMNDRFGWVMPATVNAPWLPCASSWGITSEIYFHYFSQYCKSPEEARAYLDATPKGGVTGLFVFADRQKNVSVYEVGACGQALRKPGELGEKDFVISTNNYNSPTMSPYNLGAEYFDDTFIRYDTLFKKLSTANPHSVSLDFVKNAWLANDWFDAATGTWHTVSVPNQPHNWNTCNVPGNICEGGEYQIIQYPKDHTAYLQLGVPQGTSIQYYWPDNPKPTGEYTKWQIVESPDKTGNLAGDDALAMIMRAQDALRHKWQSLDAGARTEVTELMDQAIQAWWKGKVAEVSAYYDGHGRYERNSKKQMAKWGEVFTDYAEAQLNAQMVSTKLDRK